MKNIFLTIVLAVSLFATACGNASGSTDSEVQTATESDSIQENNSFDTEIAESVSTEISGETVSQGGPYGSISIRLPEGWYYELCEVDNENLITGDYGIHFYPEGVKEGYVELAYTSSFGVCGTGLVEEKMTLAGSQVNVGYYDGSDIWNFIVFQGENEKIVALAYSVDEWWKEYSEQVMEILDTLSYHPDEQTGAIGVYNLDSEIEELSLMVSAVRISSTKATIKFHQYDSEKAGELSSGVDFRIEKKEGNSWEEADIVVEGDYGFNSVAYLIAADDVTEYEYDWEWLYGSLDVGEYRICINVTDQKDDGVCERYTAYAYFILR